MILLGGEPFVVGVAKFFRGLVVEGEGIAIAVGFGVVGDGGAHFGNEGSVLPKIFGGGVGGDVIRLGVAVFLLAARLTGESEDCFQSFVCLDIDQARKLLGELIVISISRSEPAEIGDQLALCLLGDHQIEVTVKIEIRNLKAEAFVEISNRFIDLDLLCPQHLVAFLDHDLLGGVLFSAHAVGDAVMLLGIEQIVSLRLAREEGQSNGFHCNLKERYTP